MKVHVAPLTILMPLQIYPISADCASRTHKISFVYQDISEVSGQRWQLSIRCSHQWQYNRRHKTKRLLSFWNTIFLKRLWDMMVWGGYVRICYERWKFLAWYIIFQLAGECQFQPSLASCWKREKASQAAEPKLRTSIQFQCNHRVGHFFFYITL